MLIPFLRKLITDKAETLPRKRRQPLAAPWHCGEGSLPSLETA
jgi:hypothetical protein